MNLLRSLLFLLLSTVVLTSCSNNEYTISNNQVGLLNSKTAIHELENLFKNDSIVKRLSEGILGYRGAYSQDDDKYLIYSKDGKHMLTITPREPLDSLSTIDYVEVFDKQYVTKQGIGLGATFEQINLEFQISKIEGTFTKATLFLDEINAIMTLDKKDLGLNTYSRKPIIIDQIPGSVISKSFTVWFE